MGRHAHHLHFDSGKRVDLGHREQKFGLCGGDSIFIDVTLDKARVTCPKCAAILAKQDLDAYHAISTNLKLELVPCLPKEATMSHRFAYRALMGGEHVGYVTYTGAYAGGAWYVAEIRLEDNEETHVGARLVKDPEARYTREKSYAAKDQALLAIPTLVAAKRLQTVAQIKKDRQDWAARRARVEKANATREAEEQKNRTDAVQALIEIRDGLDLSNFQRSGVEFAIRRLTKTAEEED